MAKIQGKRTIPASSKVFWREGAKEQKTVSNSSDHLWETIDDLLILENYYAHTVHVHRYL